MVDIDFTKLRSLGYSSIDDLPAEMLEGLAPDKLAALRIELPTRMPIDYAKLPSRASLVRALQQIDTQYNCEPGSALTDAALQLIEAARNGNLQAWDRIADRLDGKPQQSVDIRSVNIHATARDLSEAELDEILAKAGKKQRKRDVGSGLGTTLEAQVIEHKGDKP